MSEMVERVAVAIDAALQTEMFDGRPNLDVRSAALAVARAAIAAMQEPTEAMTAAALDYEGMQPCDENGVPVPPGAESTWKAMIKAALA